MTLQGRTALLSLLLHIALVGAALSVSSRQPPPHHSVDMRFCLVKDPPAPKVGLPASVVAEDKPTSQEAPVPEFRKQPITPPTKKLVRKTVTPPKNLPQPAQPTQVSQEAEQPAATGNQVAASATAEAESSSLPAPRNAQIPAGGSGLFTSNQLDHPLAVVHQSRPPYPKRAQRQNVEGWIKVQFVVDEHGRVDSLRIIAAEPAGFFEQSVLQCVGDWRFQPGTVDGRVVKAQVEQTIAFKLESS